MNISQHDNQSIERNSEILVDSLEQLFIVEQSSVLDLIPAHLPRPATLYEIHELSATDRYTGRDLGITSIITHGSIVCEGAHCPIHAPSNHHMRYWPKHTRLDKNGLMERICSHNIKHPDPDSISYYDSVGINFREHQCPCTCCRAI